MASGLAALFAASLASPAHAEEPTTVWYGWETLALDGFSALFVAGFSGQTDAADIMGLVGLGSYVLGPPIVHLARGHYWRSAASLVMRLAIPTIGFFMGADIGEHAPGYSNDLDLPLADGVIGAGIAMLIPVPIDAFVLGYETAPVEPKAGAPSVEGWDLFPHPMAVRDVRGSRCPGLGIGSSF